MHNDQSARHRTRFLFTVLGRHVLVRTRRGGAEAGPGGRVPCSAASAISPAISGRSAWPSTDKAAEHHQCPLVSSACSKSTCWPGAKCPLTRSRAVDVLVVAEHGWCPVVVRLRRGGSAGAAGDDRIAAGKLQQGACSCASHSWSIPSEAALGLVDQRHRPCHSQEATASLASASAQCRWPVPPPSRNHGRTGELRLWFWQESPGGSMRYPAGAATPTRRRGLCEAPSH
jgi:hypothetical protein